MKAFLTSLVWFAGLMSIFATQAAACPSGTRFSAYKGHGICAYIGQGAKAKSVCTVAQGACPSGTTREHSNNDRKRDYCCPKEKLSPYKEICFWAGTAPYCKVTSCPNGHYAKYWNNRGDGQPCLTGLKAYCCQKVLR